MRAYIESRLDKVMRLEIVSDVEWVRQRVPVSSFKDLAVGYAIGMLRTLAIVLASTGTQKGLSEEDEEAIDRMITRRLGEIIEKISRDLHR